ncbi:MAG TPA: SDR family oxidoreductase [Rhodocyclaceae bacterium]|nr:SDR family oxidoreductase [Rhodocyclaceae bacterium]
MNTQTQANANAAVAFVSGANRGLGLETARGLGQRGITVILGVRDLTKGDAAVRELQQAGIRAEAVLFDALKPATFRDVYNYIERKYGKLDILVNNAGISLTPFFTKNASSVDRKLLEDTFAVNFFAVIELTQVLLPLIRKAPAGRIVNLSSILGSLGVHSLPDSPIAPAKELAYDASKTALNAFTVHLADELRDTPIKVNSAHPGWVKTDMGGAEAPMELGEGGKTSVYLATLPADGPTGGFFHMEESMPW